MNELLGILIFFVGIVLIFMIITLHYELRKEKSHSLINIIKLKKDILWEVLNYLNEEIPDDIVEDIQCDNPNIKACTIHTNNDKEKLLEGLENVIRNKFQFYI